MKKILILILSTLLLANCVMFAGCESCNPDNYTVEQHIERITERVQKKYMTEGGEYTDFSVHPLYNENEQVVYYMVELEPEGGFFVQLVEYNFIADLLLKVFAFWDMSMYRIDYFGWRRCLGVDEYERIYEQDENGVIIRYTQSPYKVEGVLDQKKYILSADESSLIPAIKTENGFLNLINREEFSLENPTWKEEQKYSSLNLYFIPNSSFDL